MEKRLYVLEDIDCAGLDDIMKKRQDKEETKSKVPDYEDGISNSYMVIRDKLLYQS